MKSIREYYDTYGSDIYYKEHSNEYHNTHYETIKQIIKMIDNEIGKSVCDLSCGTGEISLLLGDRNVVGIDLYTYEIYKEKTKNKCYNMSFKDIVEGKLTEHFDTIICSFAMHLCEESMLPMLLYQLSTISDSLIIITPHKRPDCECSFWKLEKSIKLNRVTCKKYTRQV